MLDRKLGFVLRLLRINAELSQRDVASASGVSQPTVSRWENGDSVPDKTQCRLLCRLLDIEGQLARLFRLRQAGDETTLGRRLSEAAAVLLERIAPAAAAQKREDIPYFADVAAGVGEAQEQRSAPRSYIEVPRHVVEQDPECYALRVVGDSMEPLLTEGDIIVVSPNAPLPDGCLVAAYVEPQGDVVKTYHRTADDGIRLSSLNPEYPEIILDAKDGPAGRIWGRVVLQQREL
jgi:repressor LexA